MYLRRLHVVHGRHTHSHRDTYRTNTSHAAHRYNSCVWRARRGTDTGNTVTGTVDLLRPDHSAMRKRPPVSVTGLSKGRTGARGTSTQTDRPVSALPSPSRSVLLAVRTQLLGAFRCRLEKLDELLERHDGHDWHLEVRLDLANGGQVESALRPSRSRATTRPASVACCAATKPRTHAPPFLQ